MIVSMSKRVISEKTILRELYAKDNRIKVAKVDRVYYPYAIMVYRIKMKNPDSLMNRKIMCVMDMATGRGSIAGEDPVLVEREVDDIQVVDSVLTEKELMDKAHDFVFQTILSKIRVLYVPGIILEETCYFHKMFYVIHCKDPDKKDYFLLADSADASLAGLDC